MLYPAKQTTLRHGDLLVNSRGGRGYREWIFHLSSTCRQLHKKAPENQGLKIRGEGRTIIEPVIG